LLLGQFLGEDAHGTLAPTMMRRVSASFSEDVARSATFLKGRPGLTSTRVFLEFGSGHSE